jgi:hypothetical protein
VGRPVQRLLGAEVGRAGDGDRARKTRAAWCAIGGSQREACVASRHFPDCGQDEACEADDYYSPLGSGAVLRPKRPVIRSAFGAVRLRSDCRARGSNAGSFLELRPRVLNPTTASSMSSSFKASPVSANSMRSVFGAARPNRTVGSGRNVRPRSCPRRADGFGPGRRECIGRVGKRSDDSRDSGADTLPDDSVRGVGELRCAGSFGPGRRE